MKAESCDVRSLLLGLTSSLLESTVADVDVHVLVQLEGKVAVDANSVLNNPLEHSVAPPGGVGVGEGLGAVEANLAESRADELLGVGDEEAGAADLGHGSGDEVADNKVDINPLVLELGRESAAPVLEEGLAAGVGGEVGGGHDTGERTHGKDKTLLALGEDGSDNLGSLECAEAVDGDDVLELVAVGLEEGNGDAVGLANVVDQDANVEALDELGKTLVVGIVVLGEVHSEGLGLEAIPSELKLAGESIELRLSARDKDEVEALGGELLSKLLAETVRGAGNNSPGTLLAILAELLRFVLAVFSMSMISSDLCELFAKKTYVGAAQDESVKEELEESADASSDVKGTDASKSPLAVLRDGVPKLRDRFPELSNLIHCV